jgi:hypothetical protein
MLSLGNDGQRNGWSAGRSRCGRGWFPIVFAFVACPIVFTVIVGVRIGRQRIARRKGVLERLIERTLAVSPFFFAFELAA